MLVRIRFAKYGPIKFVGHLDTMRYFQKVVRRSGLDVSYSQGFNPHQIMSFALPLGVGVTSDAEYLDLEIEPDAKELSASDPEREIFNMLNNAMTPGFEMLAVRLVGEPEPQKHRDTAMALVSAADYAVSFKDGYDTGFESKEEFVCRWSEFIAQEEINVTKKTKKTERELNIRPFIYKASTSIDDFYGEEPGRAVNFAHAERYEKDICLYLRVAAGSVMNIKPELILEAFYEYSNGLYNPHSVQLHRMELYAGAQELVSLIDA